MDDSDLLPDVNAPAFDPPDEDRAAAWGLNHPSVKPGPKLKRCFEAGHMPALFPQLANWTQDELRQLAEEVRTFYDAAGKAIEEGWKTETFKLENFFSQQRLTAIDQARDNLLLGLLGACSEILSVVYSYAPELAPLDDWSER